MITNRAEFNQVVQDAIDMRNITALLDVIYIAHRCGYDPASCEFCEQDFDGNSR